MTVFENLHYLKKQNYQIELKEKKLSPGKKVGCIIEVIIILLIPLKLLHTVNSHIR